MSVEFRVSKRHRLRRKITYLVSAAMLVGLISVIFYNKIYTKSMYERKIIPTLRLGGKPAVLNESPDEEADKKKDLKLYGYNAWLSARIAMQRPLKDVRFIECPDIHDFGLPRISVIIPVYNEHPNVVLRTLHSLYYQTPSYLLHEVILVDDNGKNSPLATRDFKQYLRQHFFSKVRLLELKNHVGVIRARIIGAHHAKGEVLVFMDAHVEVTPYWLPPLLQVIRNNSKAVAVPTIDEISYDTFEHLFTHPKRTIWNLHLAFYELPLWPNETELGPFAMPFIMGRVYAIEANWFWQLGAFDDGLKFFGVEHYELSLKVWMCGGQILKSPCSHVAHLVKRKGYMRRFWKKLGQTYFYNSKRVIEVWLDEYKFHVYKHFRFLKNLDVGDLTKQISLRKQLQCKSYSWLVENIMPDIWDATYGLSGNETLYSLLESKKNPGQCLDTFSKYAKEPRLNKCKTSRSAQHWHFTADKLLQQKYHCLKSVDLRSNVAFIGFFPCLDCDYHPSHKWHYDNLTELMHYESSEMGKFCLTANSNYGQVTLELCNPFNIRQKWNFKTVFK